MSAPDSSQPDDPADNAPTGFIQRLLDPRSLQTLMAAGGGLLSLGLVIWLAVIGVFDEPVHAAIGLGVANLGLLAGGVALAAKTRYRTAGRAIAMLACLLLPLNLWFYDAQGLVTLRDGGHLWLPALACCVAYAAVARLLKDSLFVYAFAAGVAMTGMLFLADAQVGRFWEVLAPSTLLVGLGVACVHSERLFPTRAARDEDAAFTRGDFGLAFFRAGHALMGSGLAVLLGGRLAGRFYETLFAGPGWFEAPDVATVASLKLVALGLTLVGAYTYAYSRLVVGGRRFVVCGLLTLGWAGVIGIDLLGIEFTEELGVGLLAAVSVGCLATKQALNGTSYTSDDDVLSNEPAEALPHNLSHDVLPGLSVTAAWTAGVALALALWQLTRGVFLAPLEFSDFAITVQYVAAAATVVAAFAARLWFTRREDEASRSHRFSGVALAGVALVGGLAALLPATAGMTLGVQVLVWTLVPAGLLVWAFLERSVTRRTAVVQAAEATAALLVMYATLVAFFETTAAVALLCGVLAACFFAIASLASRTLPAAVATALAALALGEATVAFDWGVRLPLLVMSLLGLAGVAVDRLGHVERFGFAGRVALSLSGVAGLLLAANRLLVDEASLPLLGLLAGQAVIAATAAMLTPRGSGRHGLFVLSGWTLALSAVTLNAVSALSAFQRIEMIVAAVGAALLAFGHFAWREEMAKDTDKRDGTVDLNLWLGSFLTTAPLLVGLLVVRGFGGSATWVALHEGGVLLVGLLLLGSGLLCRLRATTLAGVFTTAVYLVSLVALIDVPDRLQNVAVYLMVGGGALFGGAVLLSVYRDRLLAIPDRVREGEGVFAVLKWR